VIYTSSFWCSLIVGGILAFKYYNKTSTVGNKNTEEQKFRSTEFSDELSEDVLNIKGKEIPKELDHKKEI
jgi:hypothetical protein